MSVRNMDQMCQGCYGSGRVSKPKAVLLSDRKTLATGIVEQACKPGKGTGYLQVEMVRLEPEAE